MDNLNTACIRGQFAEVFFPLQNGKAGAGSAEGALMRVRMATDGVRGGSPGEFLPAEVDLGRAPGRLREITGIKPA